MGKRGIDQVNSGKENTMYRDFVKFDGEIEDVKVLNQKIEEQTGIVDFFDEETESWRGWVEYKDGQTVVFEEVARG